MKLILYLFFLEQCLCSVLLSGGPYCDDGSNTVQHAIPGTTISVSCSVDNPNGGLNVLAWTIPSFNVSLANINGAVGNDADQPDFMSTVTSFDNAEKTTTATLSFTAMSALNGTVVNCADVTATTSSCTLFIITGPPSAPTNLNCIDITSYSITIVWDVPEDNGGDPDGIYYEVTRTPGDTIPVITTTTSIMKTGLVARSNYTFSIKANNSVGYSDSQSAIVCDTNGEVFDPLSAGGYEVCLGSNETSDYVLVNITLEICPPLSPNPATTPDFDNFTITVSGFNSVSTPYCQYEQPISEEKDYDITVTINNEEGSSEPTTTQFDASWIRDIVVDLENSRLSYSISSCTILNGDPLVVLNITNTNGNVVYNDEQSYNTESTSFNIPCSSLSPSLSYNYSLLVTLSDRTVASYTGSLASTTTTTTSVLPPSTDNTVISFSHVVLSSCTLTAITISAECTNSLSSSVAAGISVVITVPVTAIITAIITIIIMYLLCIKHNKHSEVPPSDYETPVETSTGLEMKSNTAYGQVIHTTDNPKPTPPAVYETVYTT